MMGGGTVIFTYKRKRFSSKPHKVEDLPPDPACKPQVEDFLFKEESQIETQKADEPKDEIHRTDHARTDFCETDAPLFNPEKINPLFELQKTEQSQTELLNINEPESEPQSELRIENELHSQIQIKNECSLESDNRDNPQNELRKIDEPEVELPEKHKHQIGDQKGDKLQCKGQERKDQIQLEPERLGAEVEADLSAELQKSLNKSSEPQVETKELDEMQFTYPVEERAEESRNEKQKCESDPQKSNELQSGSSVEHPVADPSDQLDSKLMSETCRKQLIEDYMEIDDGEDIACIHASSKTLTDPDRGKHERTAELPNLDQTKNNVAPNEKNLSCDKSKHTLTSKQVRPIIDLTKPPVETELDIEMEALPPESISRSWRDKEVQLLESLDKHRKTKDQLIKGEKLNFDLGLAPDLLSLQPSLDQDVFYTLQSRARPKPSSAGTSRFGLPFPTSSTMDSKGKNVNSIGTHDFFSNPGARDTFEHMHKQVLENIYTGSRLLQDKLKYSSRTNNTYRTTSSYGTSSYKLHDWSEEELDCLWIGVRRYGVNNWDAVLRDPRFIFTKFKTVEDLAARWEVEQRRLFSCPLPVPETLPLSHTNNWYSNSEAAYPLGEPYLEGSGCRAYNSSAGRYWHQPVGSGMVPMPDLIPRRGRPKYQIRRAPKAQSVTRTPSPPTSNHLTGSINNSTRNSGLPHWLREVTNSPSGLTGGAGCASKGLLNSATLKRKGLCDRVASEPLIEPNFKLGKKESERANKLVILDSDGASSEETLSA